MMSLEQEREIVLTWARSPGFAAIHNSEATDEQIADDFIAYLRSIRAGLFIKSPRKEALALAETPGNLDHIDVDKVQAQSDWFNSKATGEAQ